MYRPLLEMRRMEAFEVCFAAGAGAEALREATATREYKGRASDANIGHARTDLLAMQGRLFEKGIESILNRKIEFSIHLEFPMFLDRI